MHAGAASGCSEPIAGSVTTLPSVAFSTRDLSPKDKFEGWRDICGRVIGVEFSTKTPQAFEGEFTVLPAGPVRLVNSSSGEASYDRTPSLADNGDNSFSFTLSGHQYALGSRDSDRSRVGVGG